MRVDEEAFINRLSKAVQYKTISYQNSEDIDKKEFLGFHEFLNKSFPYIHKTLEKKLINGLSLLYKWEGKNKDEEPYLLMAHMDVAPVDSESENKWDYPPFSGQLSGGYIWGRGTMDMKSQLMGIMEAVELLVKKGFKPERTIYLAFGHDEEIGGKDGNAQIAAYLESKGIKISAVIDEGGFILRNSIKGIVPPVAAIGIAEKGYVTLELQGNGSGGHSSMPSTNTVIGRLSSAITSLEKNQFPAKFDGATKMFFKSIVSEMNLVSKIAFSNSWIFKPLILKILEKSSSTNSMIRTTTAVTMINGGIKENVLPQQAKALINFRILPLETVDSVMERVEKVVEKDGIIVNLTENYFNPSKISDVNTKEFKAMSNILKSLYEDIIVAPFLTVGTTDSRYYQNIANNIYRFCPIEVDPTGLSSIHGINEKINVDDYKNLVEFFYKLVKLL